MPSPYPLVYRARLVDGSGGPGVEVDVTVDGEGLAAAAACVPRGPNLAMVRPGDVTSSSLDGARVSFVHAAGTTIVEASSPAAAEEILFELAPHVVLVGWRVGAASVAAAVVLGVAVGAAVAFAIAWIGGAIALALAVAFVVASALAARRLRGRVVVGTSRSSGIAGATIDDARGVVSLALAGGGRFVARLPSSPTSKRLLGVHASRRSARGAGRGRRALPDDLARALRALVAVAPDVATPDACRAWVADLRARAASGGYRDGEGVDTATLASIATGDAFRALFDPDDVADRLALLRGGHRDVLAGYLLERVAAIYFLAARGGIADELAAEIADAGGASGDAIEAALAGDDEGVAARLPAT